MLEKGKAVNNKINFWWNMLSLSIVSLVVLGHFGMFLLWGPYKNIHVYPKLIFFTGLVVNMALALVSYYKIWRIRVSN